MYGVKVIILMNYTDYLLIIYLYAMDHITGFPLYIHLVPRSPK